MAGVGGGGGGGGLGVWLEASAAASSFRGVGGPGKVKLVLGVATFLISHLPDDKSVSRVRELIKKARLTRAEIAKAIANPNTNSSSLPLAPRSLGAHYKLKFHDQKMACIFLINHSLKDKKILMRGLIGKRRQKLPRQWPTSTSTLFFQVADSFGTLHNNCGKS